jgi:hypothetical protein
MHSLRFPPRALLSVAVAFTLFTAFCGADEPGRNLIQNADFADGTSGWNLARYGKGGTMVMDPEELRNGRPTLRIESVGTLTLVEQAVKVKPHTTYLLSAYVKAKDVHELDGGVGGALVMMDHSQYGSRNATGTADWQKVTTQLNTDDKTEIRVGPAIGWWGQRRKISGTAWFSEVSLTELEGAGSGPDGHSGPDGRSGPDGHSGGNLIANPNFERGEYGWELINFGRDGMMEADTTVLHDGKPTLRIDAFGEMTYARQVVTVKAHTTYRLSGYVKVKDVQEIGGSGMAGANLLVGSTPIVTRAVNGTDDWQEISTEFDTEDKTAIRVGPAIGYYNLLVSGTAWFSEMSLTEVRGN